MKVIDLKSWTAQFNDWANEAPGRLELLGRINSGDDDFQIGVSRDARGSVLQVVAAPAPARLVDQKNERQWRQWWAKVAVRAGYLAPDLDPHGLETLIHCAEHRVRVELIFDTNTMISGVGHWLVRFLDGRCDLVRTVVSDLEVHEFGDTMKWEVTRDTFEARCCFLAASRFLEVVPHAQPIWRRLDAGEETALFAAHSSDAGRKSGGRDTLLLRAARRAILDEVPRLRRFFVTADQVLSRAATHELPAGSTIAAYVNPIPSGGAFLAPVTWLPFGGDQGRGHLGELADFVWESLCICDAVTVRRTDGASWRVRGYVREANQFPSSWRHPRLFVEETPGNAGPAPPPPPAILVATTASLAIEPNAPRLEGSRESMSSDLEAGASSPGWPLRKLEPRVPTRSGYPEVPAKTFLAALGDLRRAAKKGARRPDVAANAMGRTADRLRSLLEMANLVSRSGELLPGAAELPAIFDANDLDGLSNILTTVEPYGSLLAALKNGPLKQADIARLVHDATPLARVARHLGQAVLDGDMLLYGGAYVGPKGFSRWVVGAFREMSPDSMLAEVRIANLAESALRDLRVSPARFARALRVALARPELAGFEPSTGGEVRPILVEEIAVLSSEGLSYEEVSADGILGYRSLKRRSS
jgi:hypothetical protein